MIYLLEDDENIRKLVCYALTKEGYETKGFETPPLFYKAMNENLPELIMLDIMLPEEDGLSVLKRLRSDNTTALIPIMMLTAKGSEFDKVTGLDSGADDYVTKPFGMTELISRVRALLRRELDERSALTELIRPEALEALLQDDRSLPWYGQLMTTPQTIAYFLQLAHWLRTYEIAIV
mgnify:CR=1 FL=1